MIDNLTYIIDLLGPAAPSADSARANLAGTFVNAFVNAGFGNDKLMVDAAEGESFVYKNKDHGEQLFSFIEASSLSTRERHDECYGVARSQSPVGYRQGSDGSGQIHLCSRGND